MAEPLPYIIVETHTGFIYIGRRVPAYDNSQEFWLADARQLSLRDVRYQAEQIREAEGIKPISRQSTALVKLQRTGIRVIHTTINQERWLEVLSQCDQPGRKPPLIVIESSEFLYVGRHVVMENKDTVRLADARLLLPLAVAYTPSQIREAQGIKLKDLPVLEIPRVSIGTYHTALDQEAWERFLREHDYERAAAILVPTRGPINLDLPILQLKCVTAGSNANGDADFHFCIVRCTKAQYENGAHHDAAKEAAKNDGYGGDMVVFDETEAKPWLLARFIWDSVIPIDISVDSEK